MEFDKDFLRVKGEGKEIIGVIRPVLAGFVLPQARSHTHTHSLSLSYSTEQQMAPLSRLTSFRK